MPQRFCESPAEAPLAFTTRPSWPARPKETHCPSTSGSRKCHHNRYQLLRQICPGTGS
jgi:hypothetical protein